jgi:ceramide glucosyltransferase
MLISVLGIALVLNAIYWHVRFVRAVRRRPVPRTPISGYPSVSVIRPIRGRDVDADRNIAAALDNGYPGEIETIFVVDDEDDPVLPLLREAVAAHKAIGRRGTASILIAGRPPANRTGKLNAMMAGMVVARGDLVAFGDSDSRPDQDVLRILADTLLSTPGAGCAFAPVVVPLPARTSGDMAYMILMNGMYGPAVALAAARTGDLPFIMGQLMLFRRDALAAAGGLACAEGHLVDDMRIGACMAAAGWRNIPSHHPLPIVTGGMGMLEFLKLMRRWLFFQRAGLPRGFTLPQWLRGIVFGAGLVVGASGLVLGNPVAMAAGFLASAIVTWSVIRLHREFGGAPVALRHAWVPVGIFLVAPLAHVTAILFPRVRWRGRDYSLDMNARLDAGAGRAPRKHSAAEEPSG